MKKSFDPLYPNPVVILGNGQYPAHSVPLERIKTANTLICTDGGADQAIKNGFTPSLLIGDMDSLTINPTDLSCKIIHQAGQENTDLEKALDWCIENNIRDVALVGVSGYREDLMLVNLLVMKEYNFEINIQTVTDYHTIFFVHDQKDFAVTSGQLISIVSVDNSPQLTTTGLKYCLHKKRLLSAGQGISNEATGETFSLTVNEGGVFVFITHTQ